MKIVIKEIKDVFQNIDETQFNEILYEKLNSTLPIRSLYQGLGSRLFNTLNNVYAPLDYKFLPIILEDGLNEEKENIYILNFITNRIVIKMVENSTTFLNANSELSSLIGLKYEKDYSKTYAKEHNTLESYGMSENAPINADIETIDTPNSKTQVSSNGNKEYIGADNETESNPYYYEKFLQIIDKYNIFKILIDCCKCTIYEYNTLL